MTLRKLIIVCLLLVVVLTSLFVYRSSVDSKANKLQQPFTVEVAPPKTIAQAELSQKSPPAASDPSIAKLINKELAISDRVTSDIASRIPRVRLQDDYAALVFCSADNTDSDTARNEVLNLLARSGYPELSAVLINLLDNPAEKPRFRSFATQHLGRQLKSNEQSVIDRVTNRLRKALDDRHISVRREALLALVQARDPIGIETTERWFASPVRGELEDECLDLAIRLIYDLDRRQHIPSVRRYTRDGDEAVRIAAIVALSQWGDEESRPAFEEAAKSKVMRIQRAGSAALKRLDQAKQTAATQAPKTVSPAP